MALFMDISKHGPDENQSLSNATFIKSFSTICFASESLPLKIARVLTYVLMFLVSLFGNSMTIIIVSKTSRLRKFVHLYLMNMAIADLVITVVYMPRMMVRWFYGNEWLVDGIPGLILCRVVIFLHHSSILVSIFCVFGIAFDRFCAVKYPLKRITTTRVATVSPFLIWILACALRSPFLISPVVRLKSENSSLLICSSRFPEFFGRYVTLYRSSFIAVYLACVALTVMLYVVIIRKLWSQKSPGNAQEATKARQRAGRRLLQMLISVTVAFLLCWLLYFIAIPIHGSSNLPCDLIFLRYVLAHSNSAINPSLLAFFDSGYRQGYKILLRRMFLCKAEDLAESHTDKSRENERK